MKRKQKKCVFWPQQYYTLVIRPDVSPHRPHLTWWLESGFPSHHAQNMIFPVISGERRHYSWSPTTTHENIWYSLALSGPGAVTIGVGTSGGADSWNRRKLLTDCDGSLWHWEESQAPYWHGVAGSPVSPGNHLKQKLNGFLSQPSGLTSSHFRRVEEFHSLYKHKIIVQGFPVGTW